MVEVACEVDECDRPIRAKGGKVYRFGSYLTLGEAAEIASAKRAELFGEYAGRGTND